MKKVLLVLLALTMCATFLTACKKDEPDTEDNPIVDNQPAGDNNPSDDNQNGDNKEDIVYSEGLAFTSNGDGTCYVSGIGTCTDTDVVIPPTSPDGDSVTGIGNYAFYGCNSILSITVPESVTMMGDYSISGNQLLEKVVMSNNVKTLGNGVFSFNPSLEQLEIPNSVISVGNYLIDSCALLERARYDSGYYYGNKNNPFLLLLGGASSGETMITVHNDTKIIADFALFGRKDLNAIVIHTGVTAIGNYVFSGCENLTRIYYIGNAEDWAQVTVGDYNEELTNATRYYYSETQPTTEGNFWHYVDGVPTVWEASVKYSEGLAFTSNGDGTCYVSGIGTCTDTDVVIPPVSPDGDSVTAIGDGAFFICSSITTVVIPDSITNIEYYSFVGCSSLTSVKIGEGTTYIDEEAFLECPSLTSVTVEENNSNYKSIDGNLYTKDGKTLIQYAIGKADPKFTIPNGVTNIGNCAFATCHNLTSVVIPNSVTAIGYEAFWICDSLTSITIPDSVTNIGYGTFANCSSLTSITIPDSVTNIEGEAFRNTAYYNEVNNWENGVLYIGKHLIEAKDSVSGHYIVKTGTLTIACSGFFSCNSLTGVTISDGVTSIGEEAFYNCNSLTSVIISDSVRYIGNYAFERCSGLTSVTIGDSVTSIGRGTFALCESLTDVYYKGSAESFEEITIGDSNECLTNATIHYNYEN